MLILYHTYVKKSSCPPFPLALKQNNKISNSHNQVLGFLAESSPRKPQLKGDTLVEVMFAVGIFGMIAIGIMNKGLYDAQKALEITMARQEIDAQAEALRFLHDAYISEQNNHDLRQKPYGLIWNWLKY